MAHKKVSKIMWIEMDDQLLLVISHKWRGEPLIGCHPDILIIQKDLFKQYKKSFLGKVLKNTRIILI